MDKITIFIFTGVVEKYFLSLFFVQILISFINYIPWKLKTRNFYLLIISDRNQDFLFLNIYFK